MPRLFEKIKKLSKKQLVLIALPWFLIFLFVFFQFGVGKELKLVFEEVRQWQIASDNPGANLILLWDTENGSIPVDWTCISCSPGDHLYQRFIRGNSAYGSSAGGTTTHQHANNSPFTSDGASGSGSGAAGSTGKAGTMPPVFAHTHTASISSGLGGTNIPEYRNLKVIKYDSGIPDTLPENIIAIFDDTPPSGWSTTTYNDNRYVQGENATGTGGSNTHTHTIVLGQTGAAADTSAQAATGVTVGGVSHYHLSGSQATTAEHNHEPPYISVILAKNSTADIAIPEDLIGMFDSEPPGSWGKVSGSGGDFFERFLKPTGIYGSKSGTSTHTHSNLSITTGVPSGTSAAGSGTTYSQSGHTHVFAITFGAAVNHEPPYWDAIFAKSLGPTIAISGRVYTDQGISTSTKGSIIHLAIDGSSFGTTTASTTDGSYLFGDVLASLLATSTKITVFIDDTSTGESGAVVTKYSGSGNIENLDIYANHVILRHEDEGPITNQDIGHYATSTPFSVNNNGPPYVFQVDQGHTLLVLAGKTYKPTWDVFTPYLTINGILEAGDTTITIEGSGTPFIINDGATFTASTSTLKYVSVQSVTDDFYNTKKIATTTNLVVDTAAGEVKLAEDPCPCEGETTITYNGYTYDLVAIGSQCWFAENLKVTNGNTDQSCSITRYCYDNNSANCDTYGGLYVWNDAMCGTTAQGAQGICPDGWHVPTDSEWTTLTDYLVDPDKGSKMAGGYDLWTDGNLRQSSYFGTSGLDVLPGGFRYTDGSYFDLSNYADLWSSTENGTSAWYRFLYYNGTDVRRSSYSKANGAAVRCLRE